MPLCMCQPSDQYILLCIRQQDLHAGALQARSGIYRFLNVRKIAFSTVHGADEIVGSDSEAHQDQCKHQAGGHGRPLGHCKLLCRPPEAFLL